MTNEEAAIKGVIKELLKKRGMSYAGLAELLEVSLPTVRRVLTTESLSIERLVKICNALETSLTDVIGMLSRPEDEVAFLAEEQEAFFASHPSYYSYLRCLGRGMTPEEIAETYRLEAKTTERYLTELEILKVIVRSGDEVRLAIRWPANFRFPGPMQEKFFSRIGASFLEHLTARTLSEPKGYASDFYYFVSPMPLQEGSYRKLVQETYELQLRYKQISESEIKRLPWSKLVRSTALFGVDRIDALERVTGPVRQL